MNVMHNSDYLMCIMKVLPKCRVALNLNHIKRIEVGDEQVRLSVGYIMQEY